MTPEFGAASQLEKIDMLDFADFVSINKFDRAGAQDALRDVRKQCSATRGVHGRTESMPVFGTIASRFNDDGVTALYQTIVAELKNARTQGRGGTLKPRTVKSSSGRTSSSRRRARATSRRSPRRCAAITPMSHGRRRQHAERQHCAKPGACWMRPRTPPTRFAGRRPRQDA
jgi:putative protein kinase ArgK-like GTPase of G3E family